MENASRTMEVVDNLSSVFSYLRSYSEGHSNLFIKH